MALWLLTTEMVFKNIEGVRVWIFVDVAANQKVVKVRLAVDYVV